MTQQQSNLRNTPHQDVAQHKEIYGEEQLVMKDFVVGAVVGTIIGAAVGLLLAPKAGKDLRGDVAVQAVNLKDKGVDLSSTAKEKTVQLSSQLKDQSTQLVEKVKAKTAKGPVAFDDGTVSAEGEEPLVEVVTDVVTDVTEGLEAVATEASEKADVAFEEVSNKVDQAVAESTEVIENVAQDVKAEANKA